MNNKNNNNFGFSRVLTAIGCFLIFFVLIITIPTLIGPSDPNSWDDLGKAIAVAIIVFVFFVFCIPLISTGIITSWYSKLNNADTSNCDTRKVDNDNTDVDEGISPTQDSNKKFINTILRVYAAIGIVLFTVIGIGSSVAVILIFIQFDYLNLFVDYYSGRIDITGKIIWSIIILLIFTTPLIINVITIYIKKKGLSLKTFLSRYRIFIILSTLILLMSIIGSLHNYISEGIYSMVGNYKVEVSEANTCTYTDFEQELKNRELIYELPEGKDELIFGGHNIMAVDSEKMYPYRFSTDASPSSSALRTDSDRKFPMFIYSSYASLIEKGNDTAEYYYIGPGDWYIGWRIYYIGNEIYAVTDVEEYEDKTDAYFARKEYAVVVSEKEEITIYNQQNNYFAKGGGIIDTSSGEQRSDIPTVTDKYNEKCIKVKVVDEINAETLDQITKEIALQIQKEHKR